MVFRFVPKSVTLNDLERRNGRVFCVISPNSVAFAAYYVKMVEDTPIHSGSVTQRIYFFYDIIIINGNILRESPPALK